MHKAVASFVFLAAVLAVPSVGRAQGTYVYVGRYYRPAPPPYTLVAPVAPVQLERRWSIGLRWMINSVNQTVMSEDMVMSGGGLYARYRHSRHWGFELGLEGAGSTFGNEGFRKGSFIPTVSILFHLTPRGVFDLYLLGGIGAVLSSVEIDNPPGHPELDTGRQSFGEFQAHIGFGAELRLGRSFGIVSDFRYIGRVLDTTSQDGRWYKDVDDGPVPRTSQGFQYTLGVALHF
jgi:hypothetical protein